jgi:hypothetical protein
MSKIIVVRFRIRAYTFLKSFQSGFVALPITSSPSNIIFPVGIETKAWISGLTSIQCPGWNAWSCTSITHTSALLTQEENWTPHRKDVTWFQFCINVNITYNRPAQFLYCAGKVGSVFSARGQHEIGSTEWRMNKYNYMHNFTPVFFSTSCAIKIYG